MNELIVTLVLSCSMYAPMSGDGISGGKTTASGKPVANGMAACPYQFPYGTVATIDVDLSDWGLPQDLDCQDHMHPRYARGHFDIALVEGPAKERIARAKKFGRRKCTVTFTQPASRAPDQKPT
jgi:hypothetical protein